MQPQIAPALKPFEDCGRAHVHQAKICTAAGAYFYRYFDPFLQILDKFLWLQLGIFWLNPS